MDAAKLLPPSYFLDDIWTYLQSASRPIVVYGMGNGGDKLTAKLHMLDLEVADYFASDEFVRGQSFHGKVVLTLREIEEKYDTFIILVCFGSHLASVTERIYQIAERHELYIPDMPLAGETYFDASFYRAHYEEILAAASLLADETSLKLFSEIVWYKLTAHSSHLRAAVMQTDEKALSGFSDMRVAVDVGAYRGDTLKEMISDAPKLTHAYAVEPDPKNFAKLSLYAETVKKNVTVTCIRAAAWNENGEASFAVSGNRNASVLVGGVSVSHQYKSVTVPLATVDSILENAGRAHSAVDYIKYDTEGAELYALMGSEKTIETYHPHLLISCYHRSEDLFKLPLYLSHRFADAYRFYLRRRDCIPAWDLDLIAVPVQERRITHG